MSGERFTIDTNILIYSVDPADPQRFLSAVAVMRRAKLLDCQLGLQCISEFFVVAIRKNKLPPQGALAHADNLLAAFPTFAATPAAVRAALRAAVAGQASYWDALLVAAAAEAGCTAILTEDMADRSTLFGVRIVHPFDGSGLSTAAETLLAAATR